MPGNSRFFSGYGALLYVHIKGEAYVERLGGRCRGSHSGRVAGCAEAWTSILGVDGKFKDMLTEGLWEPPTKPVFGLPGMKPIPQTLEEIKFGNADLDKGCAIGIYRRM